MTLPLWPCSRGRRAAGRAAAAAQPPASGGAEWRLRAQADATAISRRRWRRWHAEITHTRRIDGANAQEMRAQPPGNRTGSPRRAHGNDKRHRTERGDRVLGHGGRRPALRVVSNRPSPKAARHFPRAPTTAGEPAAWRRQVYLPCRSWRQIGHTTRPDYRRQRHAGAHGPSVADLSLCAVGPSRRTASRRVGSDETFRDKPKRRRPRKEHDEPPYAIEQCRVLNANAERVPLAVRRLGDDQGVGHTKR